MLRIDSPAAFQLLKVLLYTSISLHQSVAARTTAFPIFMPDSITRTDTDEETSHNPWRYRPWNWKQVLNASYQQGLLFSGKMEFNWVVTIELVNAEGQEKWSIGNLISYRHVLTTCQAVSLWREEELEVEPNMAVVQKKVLIVYGFPYLRGNYDAVQDPYNPKKLIPNYSGAGGVRISSTILLHEKCRPHLLLYDLALVELSTGIRPLTPLVGYMPVLEKEQAKLGGKEGPDMTSIMQHRTPCYIASYGKPYYNFEGAEKNIIEDFKIKFRVYYVEHRTCIFMFQEITRSGHFDGRHLALLLDKESQDKLWCFMPRKIVGSVCDHDRGAPLVCNGFVYGIVVRGAKFERCNNLVQFPVIVLKVTDYVEELYYLFDTAGLIPFKEVSSCLRVHLHPFLVVSAILFESIKKL